VWAKRLSALTETDREQIWLRFDEGSANMSELAARYNCSVSTISRILSNRVRPRNVMGRPYEAPRSEQREKQDKASQGQPGQDQVLSLAEGRERKPRRQAAQNAAN
jgi:hypothetical protein